MMRLLALCFAVLALLSASPVLANAGTLHFDPLLHFELFERSKPENLPVVRTAFGLLIQADMSDWWGLQLAGSYGAENDTFGSGNLQDQHIFRGRAGAYGKIWGATGLQLGATLGAQYEIQTLKYTTRTELPTITEDTLHLWSPYVGLQFEVIPVSGFGVMAALSFYRDLFQDALVSQFSLGLRF